MKKFKDLTPEEKKEICNGCGGKGSWIRPPYAIFFEASCDQHDYGYYVGGTEKDRKTRDLKFYQAMKKDCSTLSWFNKIKYYPWCWIYYLGVRFYGKKYFNYR